MVKAKLFLSISMILFITLFECNTNHVIDKRLKICQIIPFNGNKLVFLVEPGIEYQYYTQLKQFYIYSINGKGSIQSILRIDDNAFAVYSVEYGKSLFILVDNTLYRVAEDGLIKKCNNIDGNLLFVHNGKLHIEWNGQSGVLGSVIDDQANILGTYKNRYPGVSYAVVYRQSEILPYYINEAGDEDIAFAKMIKAEILEKPLKRVY